MPPAPISGTKKLGSIMCYVRRELSGRRLVIITLSEWQQGLIIDRGNPKGISGAADLARADITMVNRESGAGSRTLLDLWLQGAGVPTRQVKGYNHEYQAIWRLPKRWCTAWADAGPGIMAVAQALGLDFSPCRKNATTSSSARVLERLCCAGRPRHRRQPPVSGGAEDARRL